MPEQLWFTELLNRYFGGIAAALLHMVGLQPTYPEAPITNPVAMEILVVLILLAFFVAVRASLSVDKPGGLQHLVEATEEFIADKAHDVMGHGYERYIPYAVTIGYFILLGNLLGLVPGFESPTASPTVPLGCALLTFVYYHYHGLRVQRHRYIKQFIGPLGALAPLMLPIEIISHFARILSLTVRLYANMFAGDLVTLAFFSLVPIAIPTVFLGLHLGVSIIQAYVFMLLAMIYLGQATAHDH